MRSILKGVAIVALSSAMLAFTQLPPLPLPTPTPPPPLPGPITVTLSISDNEAQGSFEFEGTGIGADLTIAFENAIGLVPAALDVTAAIVNPLDGNLLGRLPGPGLGIPAAFPVLLRIGPSATSALSFAGVYTVSLHTHNLQLDPHVPLSLFKSYRPPEAEGCPTHACPFQDITKWEGRGSYRDDGSGGDFSEFLIAVDVRPLDTMNGVIGVIPGKFNDLQGTLTEYADSMPPTVLEELQVNLTEARTHYNDGDIRRAIREMRAFSRFVKKHSGEEIPDAWRAGCAPVDNVAGLLRSEADTLRFSLDRKLNQ
jgi:hypothetical protein